MSPRYIADHVCNIYVRYRDPCPLVPRVLYMKHPLGDECLLLGSSEILQPTLPTRGNCAAAFNDLLPVNNAQQSSAILWACEEMKSC